mgnify:CR=1 FL=1
MRLLALDPGIPDCGAALFEGGLLRRCAHCRVPAGPRPQQLVALLDLVEAEMDVDQLRPPNVVVVEWPRIYRPERAVKGRPYTDANPMLWLAAVAGAMLDRAAAWGAELVAVTAPEWKKQTRKGAHQALMVHAFTAEEKALIPKMPRAGRYESDALDAALLGRWYVHAQKLRGASC